MFSPLTRSWQRFAQHRPGTAQFVIFMAISTGMTVLQLALMPILKAAFNGTSLVAVNFQVLALGAGGDGAQYFVFDYAAGALPGGGGGLAYFLAVQVTIAIAQIINFFLQRNVTFKSNTSAWRAAFWYVVAYVVITFAAAVAQGFYKVPIYDLFIDTWRMGTRGEALADVATMLVNAGISVVVFFPIFKIIFKRVPDEQAADGSTDKELLPA